MRETGQATASILRWKSLDDIQRRIDLRDRAVRRAGYKWARRDDGEFELVRDRDVTVKGDE